MLAFIGISFASDNPNVLENDYNDLRPVRVHGVRSQLLPASIRTLSQESSDDERVHPRLGRHARRWRQRAARARGTGTTFPSPVELPTTLPPPPSDQPKAAATLRQRTPIDVCFLALGKPTQIDMSISIIRNIEAHSINSTVNFHLLVDKSPRVLREQIRRRTIWQGLPVDRVHLHTVASIPSHVRDLYRRLSSSATGPGPIYLYKPLLHLILPATLKRIIVLDTDLFLFEDLLGLWNEFDHFAPSELLGVAAEQCPSYQEVCASHGMDARCNRAAQCHVRAATCCIVLVTGRSQNSSPDARLMLRQVRSLGGIGFNGGVQLLALEEMRRSALYRELMNSKHLTGRRFAPTRA